MGDASSARDIFELFCALVNQESEHLDITKLFTSMLGRTNHHPMFPTLKKKKVNIIFSYLTECVMRKKMLTVL